MRHLRTAPIFRALLVFLSLFLIMIAVLPPFVAVEIMDAVSIAAGVAVVVRYGRDAWISLRESNPTPEDVWMVGGVTVALTIAGLRSLRQLGIELGIIQSVAVAFIFGLMTAIMDFGLYLKAVALPIGKRERLTPYAAIPIALVSGGLFVGAIWLLRWLLR